MLNRIIKNKAISSTDPIIYGERQRIRQKLITEAIQAVPECVDKALGDGEITYEMTLPVRIVVQVRIENVAKFLGKKVVDQCP